MCKKSKRTNGKHSLIHTHGRGKKKRKGSLTFGQHKSAVADLLIG